MTTMTSQERSVTVGLALIFASRMLGLFMILPILALHTADIAGATPWKIGIALGIYGLMQASCQIPMGWLSDRYGRHPIIAIGLALFVLGSIIAAAFPSIIGLWVGRALQGMGAVGAPILALLSELTREAVRTRAMAVIGITIGAAFSLAMVGGPILDQYIGLSGIFWSMAALGMGCFYILYKTPSATQWQGPARAPILGTGVHIGIFQISIACLHAILTALFQALPAQLMRQFALPPHQLWHIYLPVLGIALVCMGGVLRWVHSVSHAKKILIGAVLLLGLAELGFLTAYRNIFFIALALFFTIFNLLEAALPSWISRVASPQKKGAALGLYSTMQFFGIFVGGLIGGVLSSYAGSTGVIWGCVGITIFWGLALMGSAYFIEKN